MKPVGSFPRPAQLFLVLGLCAVVSGCGGTGTVPVEGTVTLDGKPLPEAMVALNPLRATDPGPFFATTDANGHFALGTADNVGGGAAVGEYRLMITTVKGGSGMETDPPPTQREIVPRHFRDGSQLFEVPEGGAREANFDMKSR